MLLQYLSNSENFSGMCLEGTLLTVEGTETYKNVTMKAGEIAGKESKPTLLVSALPVLIN